MCYIIYDRVDMVIIKTEEFSEWLDSLSLKEQLQVEGRLLRIQYENHYGVFKRIDESISELKWGNGRRVYYSLSFNNMGEALLVLLGGNKNSQSDDIKAAKRILLKLKEARL